MEMNLQPLASACFVTGQPFVEGQRVASFLVRSTQSTEVTRYDVLESALGSYQAPGFVACSWMQAFKPRKHEGNSDRAMKLTAESLFVTLADPMTDPTPDNTRLLQFLVPGPIDAFHRPRYAHLHPAIREIPACLHPRVCRELDNLVSARIGSKEQASIGQEEPECQCAICGAPVCAHRRRRYKT